ncbi:MAG: NAD-dependent epimerase/dehydratase family protein [Saprospiraceae bacterium]|jgi:UDP-2-acetamido-2,6-beta-L-arabino-hexul-4-ose reductase|nr:NAD-dependent epimerase/dehydratase family protein [Saprospiraceae bacterium]
MKKIGITGQQGFIGSHLYNFLKLQEGVVLVPFERGFFENNSQLDDFVQKCDYIVHLAAMNRHEDQNVIHDTNIKLVQMLIDACKRTQSTPHILFSSSTQEERDNLYGLSKKKGRELLEAWANENNGKTTGVVIPNVFGPFGKPFYNSVVATFCHQVANGDIPTIINDSTLCLIYVNDLTENFFRIIEENLKGRVIIKHSYEITVSGLLKKIKNFHSKYIWGGEFPDINQPLDLALFNTFRCYVSKDYYPRPFIKHTDGRGSFVEVVRANTPGQFSYSTTKPGITRGNHFHTRKAERFAVIKGKARIQLRKIDTDEVINYYIDGNNPAYVDMPIWYTHNISNVGDEDLIALFWINEPYDQNNPDTYYVNVEPQ